MNALPLPTQSPVSPLPSLPLAAAGSFPETMRILFVDDDDICAMSFTREITRQRLPFPVHRARDGRQALRVLNATMGADGCQQPHLILLDLNMPGMGGIEFLEHVDRNPLLQNHHIFLLTTSDMPYDINAALAKRISAFVFKDQPRSSLARAIASVGV